MTENNLATVDDTNVLDMLDQDAMEGKVVGMATFKAKNVGEGDKKELVIEIRQGDAKKQVKSIKDARIILRTDQYQLSRKLSDGFQTLATSSEVYQNKNSEIYAFDHEANSYIKLNDIREFTEIYRKDDLKKSDSLTRQKIMYIDTPDGVMKTYLRPSQYVGCYADKTGYRYSNPMEGMFGDIEKKTPVKWYNKTYTIKPEMYEKGGFDIVYPKLTASKDDPADPTRVAEVVKEVFSNIQSADADKLNSNDRHNKIPDEEPKAIEQPEDNLPF